MSLDQLKTPIKAMAETRAYALSLAVALLMSSASLAGLLAPNALYPTEELHRSFVSNDVVNLALGLPLLLGALALTRRGALLGLLFWPGALFYVTYNYVAYAVALPLTWQFVLYLALVGLSTWAIIRLLKGIDGAAVHKRLSGVVPARFAGGVLVGLGALFFLRAAASIGSALVSGMPLPPAELAVLVADLLVTPLWVIGGMALWRGRALGYVAGAGMGLLMTRPIDRIRKRLGLPPMGTTGYWFAPAPETWTPPADLVAFLEAGDPPVVVSLGAMALSGDDALEAAQITLAAAQQAGARAVVQRWDEPMKQLPIPPTVLHAGSILHDWLLPRAGGLVHHGGFGTTASGFRAGIPMLVIPHIIDQFIWGAKVAQLGVGPQPIPRPKLNVEHVAAALRQMQSPDVRRAAAELGAAIRAEPDGVAQAVGLIEQVVQAQQK